MQTVVLPKLGDTMEEGKILRWIKQEGDDVKRGDALAEIETEKVNIEVESFFAGKLRKILIPAGTTVAVGAPIALVGPASEAVPAGASGVTEAAAQADSGVPQPFTESQITSSPGVADDGAGSGMVDDSALHGERVFISPIARHIASEHNLDVSKMTGSGPGGRIIRSDVEAILALAAGQETTQRLAETRGAVTATEIPLSQMRKTIARRLQQSMQSAPHFYVTMTIDMTRLSELREAVNEVTSSLRPPLKVSFNDFIVKAASLALLKRPEVNVSFDGEHLLFRQHINIGIAVALPEGLIVPVIHDADRLGVVEIARESQRLAEAARTNKLKPDDFSGGTFSVSNLGMYGVDEFTAIINPPESAILAVGTITPTPVALEGSVVVRDQMKVTLSVDHRALDGAVAAGFLQDLKHLLEQPLTMLL